MSGQPANCTRCGQPRTPRADRNSDGSPRYQGGHGLCCACYHAAWRQAGGPIGAGREPVPATCRECGEPTGPASAKGRCNRCYLRWKRAGRPGDLPPVRVLRSGLYGYSPATGTARLEAAS